MGMDWLQSSDPSVGDEMIHLELFLFADLDLSAYQEPPALDHLRHEPASRRYQQRGAQLTLPSQFGNLEQYLSY
jgi:hypothetical protein